MDSYWAAALAGALAGAFNGALGRWSLKKALHRTDAVFYSVFAVGLVYRVIFLAGAVWFLRREKYIIIIPFTVLLILIQLVFAAVPLKKHGTKRDS